MSTEAGRLAAMDWPTGLEWDSAAAAGEEATCAIEMERQEDPPCGLRSPMLKSAIARGGGA